MNLSAIKAVCHNGKHATIYRSMFGGGQWISNGQAAYLVKGVEIEGPEALMELWNLSDKARGKAVIMEEITDDRRFRPVVNEEEELKPLGTLGLNKEAQYFGLYSERAKAVLWIDAEWLKPLKTDYARCFARWEFDRPLIAVYEDLTGAEALILPVSDKIADTIAETAKQLDSRPFHWPDQDREAAEAEAEAEAKLRETSSGADAPPSPEGKAEGEEGET